MNGVHCTVYTFKTFKEHIMFYEDPTYSDVLDVLEVCDKKRIVLGSANQLQDCQRQVM